MYNTQHSTAQHSTAQHSTALKNKNFSAFFATLKSVTFKPSRLLVGFLLSALLGLTACGGGGGGGGGGDPQPNGPCDFARDIPAPTTKAELIADIDPLLLAGGTVSLNSIDTSQITDMSELFKVKTAFNGDVSCWETGQVTTMARMFQGATNFNGDISKWNTGKVTTMEAMFNAARAFNGDISKWDTREVIEMSSMFSSAISFNQNIATTGNYWNMSKVKDMFKMFRNAGNFNQDLTSWDVSSTSSHNNFADDSGFATDTIKHPKWCDNTDTNNRHANC